MKTLDRSAILVGYCWVCNGTCKDPNAWESPCPKCSGTGKMDYCYVCGKEMPCKGRAPVALGDFPCQREGRSDKREYAEIVAPFGGVSEPPDPAGLAPKYQDCKVPFFDALTELAREEWTSYGDSKFLEALEALPPKEEGGA